MRNIYESLLGKVFAGAVSAAVAVTPVLSSDSIPEYGEIAGRAYDAQPTNLTLKNPKDALDSVNRCELYLVNADELIFDGESEYPGLKGFFKFYLRDAIADTDYDGDSELLSAHSLCHTYEGKQVAIIVPEEQTGKNLLRLSPMQVIPIPDKE